MLTLARSGSDTWSDVVKRSEAATSVSVMKAKIASELLPLAIPIADLWLWNSNYNQGDVGAVSESYRTFRQLKPVVTYSKFEGDDAGRRVVIAGNTQLKAARALNWDMLAAVSADHLTRRKAHAYAVADNRTSDLALADKTLLAPLVLDIAERDKDLLPAMGYDDDDVDKLLLDAARSGWEPPEHIGPPPDFPDAGGVNSGRSARADVVHQCPHCGHEFKMYPGSGPQAI